MLNFESILRPQYWPRGHGFKNLKSTQYEDACIAIYQLEVLLVVLEKKILKHVPYLYLC